MNYPPYNPYNYMNQYPQGQTMPVQRPVQPVPVTPQPGFTMRPVTAREEVVVAQIPFDGSTSWFYDTASDKVYSKTFDFNSGTAPVVNWVREQPAPVVRYATLEDLQALRNELMSGKAAVNDADE